MRISITNPGKPAESLYIIKDLYLRDVRGKKSASNKSGKDRTTVTVEKLGKVSDLMEKMKKQPMQRSPLTTFQIRELKRMYLPPATAAICSCSPSIRSCVLTIPAGTSGTDTALTSI